MFVALFIVSIAVAIAIHEFGHFATAKLFGMKVQQFFLGFGPTLWSFQRGETEYGVKVIPAGGFVKIVGMNEVEDIDQADAERAFHRQSAWKRAIVLAAGSVTHFLVAFVLVFVALAVVGVPRVVDGQLVASNEITKVTAGSPAEGAGLRAGDMVMAVDGVPTPDFESVRDAILPRAGETVTITIERDGDTRNVSVAIAAENPEGERQGFLGVAPAPVVERLPVGEALAGAVVGEWSVPRLVALNVQGLAVAFSPDSIAAWLGQVGEEGPRLPEGPTSLVGAAQVAGALGDAGEFTAFLMLLASLNIVLGLLNMLPLPPLDGGHLAVLLVEESVNAVRRRRGRPGVWRVNPAVITPLALAVLLFFTALTVTAVYIDITKPASGLLQ
jgi:membrane-associated protease RseP (regulator of RpoE activity)